MVFAGRLDGSVSFGTRKENSVVVLLASTPRGAFNYVTDDRYFATPRYWGYLKKESRVTLAIDCIQMSHTGKPK